MAIREEETINEKQSGGSVRSIIEGLNVSFDTNGYGPIRLRTLDPLFAAGFFNFSPSNNA